MPSKAREPYGLISSPTTEEIRVNRKGLNGEYPNCATTKVPQRPKQATLKTI
jgi:hypothetical protein